MKNTKLTLVAALAVALAGVVYTASPAAACEPTLNGWTCSKANWFGIREFRGTQKELDTMWKFLKKNRYPGEIVVTTKEDYERTKGGWNKRMHCKMLAEEDKTRDWLVNNSKVYYCEFAKHGYPVPKPKIIKAY